VGVDDHPLAKGREKFAEGSHEGKSQYNGTYPPFVARFAFTLDTTGGEGRGEKVGGGPSAKKKLKNF